jgi:hypothetical protein
MSAESFFPADRVEHVGAPASDQPIDTGEIGRVIKVEADRVFVLWPGRGIHSVPAASLRLLPPEVTRTVAEASNARMWGLIGEQPPPQKNGRPRDPYFNQGCHPDVVDRVWNELGKELRCDCRAQASGRPVLAHPETDRIIALVHGTAYALSLTPDDFAAALKAGATTNRTWSGGSVTDLAQEGGPGWLWGRWYDDEPSWLQRAYAASGAEGSTS